MLDQDQSQRLWNLIPPAARATARPDIRLRDVIQRAFIPERPGLRDTQQAVADVLFALPTGSARRFAASGVMYFDLVSPDVVALATREAWEAACDRVGLGWADGSDRVFLDRATSVRASRAGARVQVHVRGEGGCEETRSIPEEDLVAAENPMELLRALGDGPLRLDHPPSLAAVSALASAHRAVETAEHLAHEAAWRVAPSPPSGVHRVAWRVESAARLRNPGAPRRRVTPPDRAGTGGDPAPFDAVLAIFRLGMLLESITPEEIVLVCPLVE